MTRANWAILVALSSAFIGRAATALGSVDPVISVLPNHADLQYQLNEQASFTIFVKAQPTSAEFRIFLEGSFPDSTREITLSALGSGLYFFQTGLTQAGKPTLTLSLVLEDAEKANAYKGSIVQDRSQLALLEQLLSQTTDTQQHQALQAQINHLNSQIQGLAVLLAGTREVIGQVQYTLRVNGHFDFFPNNQVTAPPSTHVGAVALQDGAVVKAALDQIVIDLKRSATDAQLQALNQGLNQLGASIIGQDPFSHAVVAGFSVATDIPKLLDEVANFDAVDSAHPNLVLTSNEAVFPDPPVFGGSGWYRTVDLPNAWGIVASRNSTGRVHVHEPICIVDSGITVKDNLENEFSGGVTLLPSWVFPQTDLGEDDDPNEPAGHGTLVAALAAGSGESGTFTTAGVAWGAPILNGDVYPSGMTVGSGPLFSQYVAAIESCSRAGARLINLSQGPAVPKSSNPDEHRKNLERAYRQFRDALFPAVECIATPKDSDDACIALPSQAGLLILSAGNEAFRDDILSPPFSPDRARLWHDHVISVGAVDGDDKLASFSNFGKTVDLFAPGVNIGVPILCQRDPANPDACLGGTQSPVALADFASGTSFSAPMITGTAALMLTVNPSLTTEQIRSILIASADQVDSGITTIPQPLTLIPRLNAARAVASALLFKTTGQAMVDTESGRSEDYFSAPVLSRLAVNSSQLTPLMTLPGGTLVGFNHPFLDRIEDPQLYDPIRGRRFFVYQYDVDMPPALTTQFRAEGLDGTAAAVPHDPNAHLSSLQLDMLTGDVYAVYQPGAQQTVCVPISPAEGGGCANIQQDFPTGSPQLVRIDGKTLSFNPVQGFQGDSLKFSEVSEFQFDSVSRRVFLNVDTAGRFAVDVTDPAHPVAAPLTSLVRPINDLIHGKIVSASAIQVPDGGLGKSQVAVLTTDPANGSPPVSEQFVVPNSAPITLPEAASAFDWLRKRLYLRREGQWGGVEIQQLDLINGTDRRLVLAANDPNTSLPNHKVLTLKLDVATGDLYGARQTFTIMDVPETGGDLPGTILVPTLVADAPEVFRVDGSNLQIVSNVTVPHAETHGLWQPGLFWVDSGRHAVFSADQVLMSFTNPNGPGTYMDYVPRVFSVDLDNGIFSGANMMPVPVSVPGPPPYTENVPVIVGGVNAGTALGVVEL